MKIKKAPKVKALEIIGTIILFFGILFAFLPHAWHDAILQEEVGVSHFTHTIYGILAAIVGLGILIWSNKIPKGTKN
ncbi:MAG TPA: hypothetical protein VI564_06035 [Candidatus Nanoarchaeia archaeon]|nr:hypothetical protein [Candidatus Nanoarchaeia archaeon]